MTPKNLVDAHRMLHASARMDLYTFSQLAFKQVTGDPYEDNWHVAAICRQLERVRKGEVKRLIISMPPRSLKSYLASICFPAFLLGHDPGDKIICASYAQPIANDFSREMRRLMRSDFYRSLFPNTHIDPARSSLEEIGTVRGGYRISTSVGGALTARGARIMLIDDSMKAGDAHSETMRESAINWYNSTVPSRLNNQKLGAIIIIAQRLHMYDLIGHLLEADGWEHLCLPMEEWQDRKVEIRAGRFFNRKAGDLLHPARVGPAEIERLRRDMGEHDFQTQYNQRPLPPGGALFKMEWLKRYAKRLPDHKYRGIFQSWDTGYEIQNDNDYSVCTTWGITGDDKFHLLDVYRDRLPFPDLEKKVRSHRKEWQANLVIVEKHGAGISLSQNIAQGSPVHWLKTLRPETSKTHRASQQTPKFERGEVFFPENAPWLDTLQKELLSFPHSKHDDQVDSMVQFLMAFDLGRLFQLAEGARHTL
jgi:predicted phage terminase large subunit-like protein